MLQGNKKKKKKKKILRHSPTANQIKKEVAHVITVDKVKHEILNSIAVKNLYSKFEKSYLMFWSENKSQRYKYIQILYIHMIVQNFGAKKSKIIMHTNKKKF